MINQDTRSIQERIANPKNHRDLKIKNIIEKEMKEQKNAFTSFELNVPNASLNFLKNNIFTVLQSSHTDYVFCKHKRPQVENIYQKLLENYEREFGDLTNKTDGNENTIYLIASPLLNPGLKKTNNYKYIGFVLIEKDNILLAYMHPFFRNRGLMTFFLLEYMKEFPLIFSPPISKSMSGCLKKIDALSRENEEIRNYQINSLRNSFKRKNPKAKIDELNEVQFLQLKTIYEKISIHVKKVDENLDKLVELLIEVDRNPELKKQLESSYLNMSEEEKNELTESESDFINGWR